MMKWKQEENGRTALLLDGARRVGKSYIAEEFAKAEYKTHIMIDFNRVSKDITDLFINYLEDLDTFFL
ncbi:MAG TPA: AAA family ATPase, partial [Sphaerochaeta sp.]|nr:AAA family ATPase [Sphaerochaeta sp.]